MLRKKFGSGLLIEHVSGTDFPEDLSKYDLIIHCGACMFNRKYVLSRVEQARKQNIPMTNYGVTIAYLAGILDKIDYCCKPVGFIIAYLCNKTYFCSTIYLR